MLQTAMVRALTARDLPAVRVVVDRDPAVNVFVRHRADVTELGGEQPARMWGYFDGDELAAVCHGGSNLVPAQATREAIDAFAIHVVSEGPRPASIAGLQTAVLPLWEQLEPLWGPARSLRSVQPFLTLDGSPTIAPDPRVRHVTMDEFHLLYPACVAMFKEEVGVDPEHAGGGHSYRARVAQLITQGWAFAIIEDGEVLFKTEVGAASPHACQLQGVWVHPDRRGEGIAAGALAAVVAHVQATVAPVVTLYVNDHNRPARATYARAGFRQTATFASVLL